MEYKFEIDDRVYSKKVRKWGKVSEIFGECVPYLVSLESGDRIWHCEEDLMLPSEWEKEIGEVMGVNDAGEDTSCTIDETLEERGKRYGTFKGHSEASQALFRTATTHALLNDVKLSEVHREALMMICHKIARIVNGDPNYDDSWRDIAGYATLVVKHINGEDI